MSDQEKTTIPRPILEHPERRRPEKETEAELQVERENLTARLVTERMAELHKLNNTLTPEEHSNLFDQILTVRQKAGQEAAEIVKSRLQQKEDEIQNFEEKAKAREQQINEHILKLDSQLPIKQYLETLREKISSEQKIERVGPVNGEIGYSLIYRIHKKNIPIGLKYISDGNVLHDTNGNPCLECTEREIRETLCVILGINESNNKSVMMYKEGCADGLGYDKEPLNGDAYSRWKVGNIGNIYNSIFDPNKPTILSSHHASSIKTNNIEIIGQFDVNSNAGHNQFVQALSSFYMELKTGSAK